MRNYDITQVLWHETGKMSRLNIFQNQKKRKKKKKKGKCNSHVISMKVCLTLPAGNAIHKHSCSGYHEKIRHF